MKKTLKQIGFIAIALMVALTIVSCGGDDPKALAKQTADLTKESLNPLKAVGNLKKLADIEKKVAKLSADKQAIYYAELTRLSGDALGGLLNSAGNLLNSTQDIQDAFKTVNDVLGDTMNSAGDILGATLEVQDAQDALKQANDMLKSANDLLGSQEVQDAQDALKQANDALKSANDLLGSFGF